MPRTLGLILCLLSHSAFAADIEVPAGFQVTLFASDDLAHDIQAMAIDRQGRVTVSGPGYIRILHDDNGDGQAERATDFARRPLKGAHGLLWLDADLLCTGDDTVMLLPDRDQDGQHDGPAEIWAQLRNPEHGANGLVHGPDGWVYLVCGNDAGANEHMYSNSSPVARPDCGALIRFHPSGKPIEVLAHGFRNPYDVACHPQGHWFLVDADGERDQYLPWYAPTRLFDVGMGQHHGWVWQGWQQSWSRPAEFVDSRPRLCELGRGSPTGIEVYAHTQFPAYYQGGLFSCCWTLGRVYFLRVTAAGATYQVRPEIFWQTKGDTGFAPVDVAVGMAGELYIAVGGRGTQGAVYCVRYRSGLDSASREVRAVADSDPLNVVLRAPQPLATWSRAQWRPLADALDRSALVRAAADPERRVTERIRAIEVLVEAKGGLHRADIESIGRCDDPEVQARLVWGIARSEPLAAVAPRALAEWTAATDPRVARAAWEGLLHLPPDADVESAHWQMLAQPMERSVRDAAVAASIRHAGLSRIPDDTTAGRLARLRVQQAAGTPILSRIDVATAVEAYHAARTKNVPDLRLEALRIIQFALGDVHLETVAEVKTTGYSAQRPESISAEVRRDAARQLSRDYPDPDPAVNRELARTLGMLGSADWQGSRSLLDVCVPTSDAAHDLHYLMAWGELPIVRTAELTRQTADSLLRVPIKMAAAGQIPSRNWPHHIGLLIERLCNRDRQLSPTLIEHPEFSSPLHALIVLNLPNAARGRAATKLLAAVQQRLERGEQIEWNDSLIESIGCLPADDGLLHLRQLWIHPELHGSIIAVMARNPQVLDRERFITALAALDPQIVSTAAAALQRLGPPTGEAESEWIAAIEALQRWCSAVTYRETRHQLAEMLKAWSGKMYPYDIDRAGSSNWQSAYDPWFALARQMYPAMATHQPLIDDPARQLLDRLPDIDWQRGNAERGAVVFRQQLCHACHRSQQRLGPDLHGIARRLDRRDLFLAIVQPNRDVSPAYHTQRLETRAGRIYQGQIIYESPEGTLLQTGPSSTIRIADDEIVSKQTQSISLMPEGLLKNATDQELSDLYAYLQSIPAP